MVGQAEAANAAASTQPQSCIIISGGGSDCCIIVDGSGFGLDGYGDGGTSGSAGAELALAAAAVADTAEEAAAFMAVEMRCMEASRWDGMPASVIRPAAGAASESSAILPAAAAGSVRLSHGSIRAAAAATEDEAAAATTEEAAAVPSCSGRSGSHRNGCKIDNLTWRYNYKAHAWAGSAE